jgi:uncharacterized RDD family membrane protein YckC
MYCSRCGTAQADNAAFCGTCGQPLGAALRPAAASAVPVAAAPTPPVMVATPMGIPAAHSPYAGFWLRFVAYVIDSLMITLVCGVVILIIVAVIGVGTLRGSSEPFDQPERFFMAPALIFFFVAIFVVAMCGSWLYYALLESSVHQGTLGKMALGLIVTDMQGRRVTFARASGRFFAKIITGLIPFAIGYIMAGFTQKKQALHDMIASCLVLKKP